MATEYHIRRRGKAQGPFTLEKLLELSKRGAFGRSDEVSLDGKDWARAVTFPELFPAPVPIERRRSGKQASDPQAVGTGSLPGSYSLQPPTAQVIGGSPSFGFPPVADAPAEPGAHYPQAAGWFYTSGDAELGPVSLDVLKQLAADGQLTSSDFLWTEGMQQWVEANSVLGPYLGKPSIAVDTHSYSHLHPAPASGMAVGSFVCGLLGITIVPLLGSLLAVILGHVALGQIRRSSGRQGGKGLAVAGLVLGYLVLVGAIIGIALWLILLFVVGDSLSQQA